MNLKNNITNLYNGLLEYLRQYRIFNALETFIIKFFQTIYKTIFTFNLHAGVENAGYIAYSVMFAIFPFMIFFTIIIGYFGQTEIGIRLLEIISDALPNDINDTLLPVIDNVINGPKAGILSIATLTLIWSASSLVQGLKSTLDRAFRIKNSGPYFLSRLGSIAKFLLITIFIIISIFLTIIFPKIIEFIQKFIFIPYNPGSILMPINSILLYLFLFIFIVSIYYIIPSKRGKIKHVLWGSLLTLIGWIGSLKLLTFYFQKIAKFQVVYGSLAGIIITLFFFYIMAIILIFGAEFNYNINEVFYKNKITSKKNSNIN